MGDPLSTQPAPKEVQLEGTAGQPAVTPANQQIVEPLTALINRGIKAAKIAGGAGALATLVVWIFATAMETRTGLSYAWLTGTAATQALRMVSRAFFDLVDATVNASPIILALLAVIIGTGVLLRRARARAVASGRDYQRERSALLSRLAVGGAGLALIFLMFIPSTFIRNQLSAPILPKVSEKTGNPIFKLALAIEKLQVCAAIGDHARMATSCSGPANFKKARADAMLRDIYLGYLISAVAIALFVMVCIGLPSELALAVATWKKTPFAIPVIAISLVALLVLPYVYGAVRAPLGGEYGHIAQGNCSGYKIPASTDEIALYDPYVRSTSQRFPEKQFVSEGKKDLTAFAAALMAEMQEGQAEALCPGSSAVSGQ